MKEVTSPPNSENETSAQKNTETCTVPLKEKFACLEASKEGSVKCGKLSLKTINLIKNPFSLIST